ncbi:hypothetical protein ACFO26_09415 [Lactococcus nasutitermitis]|uniref:Uncharacterized protein n=1 Tax=Lactococcus nasutitermitis TaxID=1652957 RepID=A0ABV9JFB3_9LACT|nr:hypothetical protein [Lactococcus nasutitermitis]
MSLLLPLALFLIILTACQASSKKGLAPYPLKWQDNITVARSISGVGGESYQQLVSKMGKAVLDEKQDQQIEGKTVHLRRIAYETSNYEADFIFAKQANGNYLLIRSNGLNQSKKITTLSDDTVDKIKQGTKLTDLLKKYPYPVVFSKGTSDNLSMKQVVILVKYAQYGEQLNFKQVGKNWVLFDKSPDDA